MDCKYRFNLGGKSHDFKFWVLFLIIGSVFVLKVKAEEIQFTSEQQQILFKKKNEELLNQIKTKQVKSINQIESIKEFHQKSQYYNCRVNFLVEKFSASLAARAQQSGQNIFVDAIQYQQVRDALKPLLESDLISKELEIFLKSQFKQSYEGNQKEIKLFLEKVASHYTGTSEESINFNKNITEFLEHLSKSLNINQSLDQKFLPSKAMLQILMHPKLKPLGALALQDKLYEVSRLSIKSQREWIAGKTKANTFGADKSLVSLLSPLNELELSESRKYLILQGADKKMLSSFEQQNALQEFLLHPAIKRELSKILYPNYDVQMTSSPFAQYLKLNTVQKKVLAASVIDRISSVLPVNEVELELLMSKLQEKFKLQDTDEIRAVLRPWLELKNTDYEPLVEVLVKQWDTVFENGYFKEYIKLLSNQKSKYRLVDLLMHGTVGNSARTEFCQKKFEFAKQVGANWKTTSVNPYAFLALMPAVMNTLFIMAGMENIELSQIVASSCTGSLIYGVQLAIDNTNKAKALANVETKTKLAQKYAALMNSEVPDAIKSKSVAIPEVGSEASQLDFNPSAITANTKNEKILVEEIPVATSETVQSTLVEAPLKVSVGEHIPSGKKIGSDLSLPTLSVGSKTINKTNLKDILSFLEKNYKKPESLPHAVSDLNQIISIAKGAFIRSSIESFSPEAIDLAISELKRAKVKPKLLIENLLSVRESLAALNEAELQVIKTKQPFAARLKDSEFEKYKSKFYSLAEHYQFDYARIEFESILDKVAEIADEEQIYVLVTKYLEFFERRRAGSYLNTSAFLKFFPSLVKRSYLESYQVDGLKRLITRLTDDDDGRLALLSAIPRYGYGATQRTVEAREKALNQALEVYNSKREVYIQNLEKVINSSDNNVPKEGFLNGAEGSLIKSVDGQVLSNKIAPPLLKEVLDKSSKSQQMIDRLKVLEAFKSVDQSHTLNSTWKILNSDIRKIGELKKENIAKANKIKQEKTSYVLKNINYFDLSAIEQILKISDKIGLDQAVRRKMVALKDVIREEQAVKEYDDIIASVSTYLKKYGPVESRHEATRDAFWNLEHQNNSSRLNLISQKRLKLIGEIQERM